MTRLTLSGHDTLLDHFVTAGIRTVGISPGSCSFKKKVSDAGKPEQEVGGFTGTNDATGPRHPRVFDAIERARPSGLHGSAQIGTTEDIGSYQQKIGVGPSAWQTETGLPGAVDERQSQFGGALAVPRLCRGDGLGDGNGTRQVGEAGDSYQQNRMFQGDPL